MQEAADPVTEHLRQVFADMKAKAEAAANGEGGEEGEEGEEGDEEEDEWGGDM